MRSSRRPEQVAGTIRQVVTDALAREVRDKRVGFVTVTGVLVTNDLSHARVMVSVPGDESAKARALQGLQSASGFLRSRAAKALTHAHGAGAALRARPGRLACGEDRGAAVVHPAGGAGLIGALLVDKPAGITSHDAVQRVRRLLGIRSVGHTGTLDPFATGLLILLVGRATRLAQFIESESKTYVATVRLGVRTDTDDLTGAAVEEHPVDGLTRDAVVEALAGFEGEQLQRAPAFSAKHIDGERSHRLARRGAEVEAPESTVRVHRIEALDWSAPVLTFRATVSAGTYLRAIGRDLGDRLGVGGHLTALRREAIGSLRVEDAAQLDRVTAALVRPATAVLGHLPAVALDAEARAAVMHGRAVADRDSSGRAADAAVALMEGTELVAVARAEGGWLRPTVVLGTA